MSTNRRIYLDHNAGAPLCAAARAAITDALADAGNPSSIHAEGRRARERIERARGHLASLLGRPREQIVFTSGGTEANALGVATLARAAERRGLPSVVATTSIEHLSLRGAIAELAQRGWQVRELHPFADYLDDTLGHDVGVLAAALVNHELGTLLPPPRLLARARARGALIHLDAVQAAGKLALGAIPADSLAVSAHKIGGPQGAGALAIAVDDGPAPGRRRPPGARAQTWHRERDRHRGVRRDRRSARSRGRRSAGDARDDRRGRDRVPAVEGLAARRDPRRALSRALELSSVAVHGGGFRLVGGTENLGFLGARGQDVVIALDLAGVAVSTGAACARAARVQPSQVLLGLGMPADEALSAVRFSLGRTTTAAEIDEVLALLLRDTSPGQRRHGR